MSWATAAAGAADRWTFKNKEFFILAPSAGPSLLQQCSREAPKTSGIYWRPDGSQIKTLEAGLTKYLANRVARSESVPAPGVYRRQYVGIVQNGRRLIYGNFYRQSGGGKVDETRDPVIACDGGPAFWGVVFDPKSRTFDQMRLNGP